MGKVNTTDDRCFLKTRSKKLTVGEVIYRDGRSYIHIKKPGSQEYEDVLTEDFISDICNLSKQVSQRQGPPHMEAAR